MTPPPAPVELAKIAPVTPKKTNLPYSLINSIGWANWINHNIHALYRRNSIVNDR